MMNTFNPTYALSLFRECLKQEYEETEEGTSYAFKLTDGRLQIFFQWSEGFKDWRNNIDFPAKPYKNMINTWYIHRGFLRAWKSVEDIIGYYIGYTYKGKIPFTEIEIIGYSHGAALAALCHEYCKYHLPDIKITGYGFGCPNVLWGFYKPELLKRWEDFTVIRNYDDIVTHLPPAWLGYKHVGAMVDLTPKGTYNKRGQALYDRYILPHTEDEIIKHLEETIEVERINV